jgi:hypothetical protein
MPRLSLYKPEKGPDFRFLDRTINEQFQVGGTDIFVHKYLGPVNPEAGSATPTTPDNSGMALPELGIQDVLLMENRDRHYDPDVYQIRGIYTMQDLDFNLSQFGLFLQNDNIMITFHLSSSFNAIGRKLMSGDVLELPHLKDEYALNDAMVALKRFYVVTDVTRPSTGFSQTWYPHLIRAKCQPLIDSQEFKEILDAASGDGAKSLRDVMSVYNRNIEINDQIIAQAEADAPKSGFDATPLYVLPEKANGELDVADTTMDDSNATTDNPSMDASMVLRSPDKNLYVGYLTDDGIPPNGAPYTFGIQFPHSPVIGQFHLRNDFMPNRLFRWDGKHWVKFEDNVRMTLNNYGNQDVVAGTAGAGKEVRETLVTSFINNNTTATIAGKVVKEKQALSKALKPKADH